MSFSVDDTDCGYDVSFKNPSSFILAGASQSGKTTFTLNILRNIDVMFEKPSCKENIIYFYNQWQDGFESFKNENIVKEWIEKLPSTDDIIEKTLAHKESGSVIIIDDFAQQLNRDTIDIFTKLCHHTNSVIILLTQNLFSKNPVFREISLNATYIVLFKNPRDASQIITYARQFAPGRSKYIVDAFREATRKPYSYMLFDLHQSTPDSIRVRSNVLPHEFPMQAYCEKKCTI
jgi:predicted kinase